MLSRTSGVFIAMLILAGRADADNLALAKKGAKQPPVMIETAYFGFKGTLLTFVATVPSGQADSKPITARDVETKEWAIEIQLTPTLISVPKGAFNSNPILTSYPPNLGTVRAPELYDSINQATHDVGLQQAELENAQKTKMGTTAGEVVPSHQFAESFASLGFPTMRVGDLTSCKGPGQDWIIKGNDAQRRHLPGKIVSIANGWLTFQIEGSTNPQKYRLYSEVVAIGIGTCP